jgi:uncharacterized protein (TIGR03435 family)
LLDSVPYDIEARPEGSPQLQRWQLTIQALLADRFQLRIHRETKELPIYALVLARKDGALGPSLTKAKEGTCMDPTHAAGIKNVHPVEVI